MREWSRRRSDTSGASSSARRHPSRLAVLDARKPRGRRARRGPRLRRARRPLRLSRRRHGPRGYAVFTYDLRGHGRSPGRRGHIDRFSDYLADARRLPGGGAARVPGHAGGPARPQHGRPHRRRLGRRGGGRPGRPRAVFTVPRRAPGAAAAAGQGRPSALARRADAAHEAIPCATNSCRTIRPSWRRPAPIRSTIAGRPHAGRPRSWAPSRPSSRPPGACAWRSCFSTPTTTPSPTRARLRSSSREPPPSTKRSAATRLLPRDLQRGGQGGRVRRPGRVARRTRAGAGGGGDGTGHAAAGSVGLLPTPFRAGRTALTAAPRNRR